MKNLSLNQKIASILCLFSVVLIGISILSVRSLANLNESLQDIVNRKMVRSMNSANLRGSFRNAAISLFNELAEDEKSNRTRMNEKALADNEKFEELFEKSLASASEEGRPKYLKVREIYHSWWTIANKAREAKNAGKPFNDIVVEARDQRRTAEEMLAELIKLNEEKMEEAKKEG